MPVSDRSEIAGEKMISKRRQRGVLATIYSIFFVSPTLASISPAMASMSAAYPQVSAAAMGYVVSITAIAMALASLVSGALAGRRLKFQWIIIPSAVLYIAAGCFPLFLADGEGFAALLVSRGLFGAALGMIAPLGNALIMAFHDREETRATIVGRGNVSMNIGSVVTNLIAGFLCLISWQSTFLLHLLGFVLLVLAAVFLRDDVFTKNPALLRAEAARRQSHDLHLDDDGKGQIPFGVFGYLLIFLLVLVVTQPLVIYNASLLGEANLGGSATAGIAAALFSLGGATAAARFRSIYGLLKEWLCPVAFVIGSFSSVLGFLSTSAGLSSLVLYGVALFLVGVATSMVSCFIPVVVGAITPPRLTVTAMGMVTFVMSAGSFLVAPFAQLVQGIAGSGSLRPVLLAAAGLGVATALVLFCACLIKNAFDRRMQDEKDSLSE